MALLCEAQADITCQTDDTLMPLHLAARSPGANEKRFKALHIITYPIHIASIGHIYAIIYVYL